MLIDHKQSSFLSKNLKIISGSTNAYGKKDLLQGILESNDHSFLLLHQGLFD